MAVSEPSSALDRTAKARLRRELLDRRRAMPAAARTADGATLGRHVLDVVEARAARIVAAYVPVRTEPGSVALLDGLLEMGVSVLLPVIRSDGDLDWAGYDGTLVDGTHGVREPAGPRLGVSMVATAALVLVPALAVDRGGTRLGRGGGYYDRALSRVVAGVPVAALLYDGEVLDRLPAEPHDRPVTAVVTPLRGWADLGYSG